MVSAASEEKVIGAHGPVRTGGESVDDGRGLFATAAKCRLTTGTGCGSAETKVPATGALGRERRDTYMVTIVLGRKGILRGKQAIQVKVRSDTSQLTMHPTQKFNHTNDGILLPRSMLLTKMTIVLPSNNMYTRVTFRKTLMSELK